MSLFNDIEVEDLGLAEDKVGGGSFGRFEKTGYYDVVIEKAYAGVSNGGAFSVNLTLKREDGAKLNVTEYISSGTAKGCKNYYLDKDGNKAYLPGYNKIKSLDALLGFDRAYPKTEKDKVMLWDKDLKKELPVDKEVIKEWLGKKIGILVTKKLEDKYGEESNYREVFDVEHFLRDGRTRNEIVAGTSGFKDKWLATKNESYILDKREQSKNKPYPPVKNENTDTDAVPDDAPF
jgi:hypothetical protein